VPPESEVIVPGKIIDPVINVHNAMVSGIPSFVNKTGLLMAYGLVKPNMGVIPLRLLNVTEKECSSFKCGGISSDTPRLLTFTVSL
jgi:hypothetical protein